MTAITTTAMAFFDACDTGKGWESCKAFCTPDASFASQAEPLADIKTVAGYTDWMLGLMTFIPNGSYVVKSFATDAERNNICAFGVFSGTHSGAGGPCPPTGKTMHADYVYAMEFADGKIRHITKIWNAGWSMRELGWG